VTLASAGRARRDHRARDADAVVASVAEHGGTAVMAGVYIYRAPGSARPSPGEHPGLPLAFPGPARRECPLRQHD